MKKELKSALVVYSIYFLLVCLLVVLLTLHLQMKNEDKTLLNFISIFGSYLSFVGVIIAIQQILSIKNTTDMIKDAVDANTKQIKRVLYISDISKATILTEQIQDFIRASNNENAMMKMKTLKTALVKAESIGDLKEITSKRKYKEIILNISTDITNMDNHIRNNKSTIDLTIVNSHLEDISTTLLRFENKLKE